MSSLYLSNYDELVDLIAKTIKDVVDKRQCPGKEQGYDIPVGVSVRHLHITDEVLHMLYGEDYQLTKLKDLEQPGEFAAHETVTLVGPRMKSIQNVRILGPTRSFTQVELSKTDGILLGLDLPIKVSGDIKGSLPITLVGPKGSVYLREGAIRAARHIHITPEIAKKINVRDKQVVNVQIPGEAGIIFNNVIIRVNEKYKLEFHIDTDEGNAADVGDNTFCKILK
ncbi:MAG: phosphate propanoyltransferase [Spirochaetes bacterium]|nr:phosphate propanoyltransferase [Spirochaetota bacterium]